MITYKENLHIDDHVKCESCYGKGWYSVDIDEYYSEHTCNNCRGNGYLIVRGFNTKHGAILTAPSSVESGYIAGEFGNY